MDAKRKADMEASINMADLRDNLIPVGSCEDEEDEMGRESANEARNKEADEAYRRLVLGEIQKVSEKTDETRDEIKSLNTKIDHFDDRLSTLYGKQMTDKNELLEKINFNESRIEINTELAAQTRESLRKHIEDTEAEEQIQAAEKRAVKSHRIAVASVAFAASTGILSTVMMVLQYAAEKGGAP